MMNSAPGYTLPRVTACLHFMESALTTQWDSHYHASEQETISANLGIYGYIMAKYLRNMALKCYLGGLFPTFFAFSVNRCVIFPSILSPVTPGSHLGLGLAWVTGYSTPLPEQFSPLGTRKTCVVQILSLSQLIWFLETLSPGAQLAGTRDHWPLS